MLFKRAAGSPAEDQEPEQPIGLHSLKPAPGSRRPRKRVGRGEGSGTGKTAGRGQKGAGSRSGSKSRSRFEGGQMPIHMRMRKLRGPHMKKSMPFEMFRTHTQPVNVSDLESRFDAGAEVTVELMQARGLATRKGSARQGARQGRSEQGVDRPRSRFQQGGARAHRGRRRRLSHPRQLASQTIRSGLPRLMGTSSARWLGARAGRICGMVPRA